MAPPSKAGPSPGPTPGRRPPFQLRTSSSRKASNPALSLVYASSGSSMPPQPASASTSRCEEALSRQLDEDLGGKQMGLRSRRSSTATLRTINTVNGVVDGGPQSPRESIAEVEEEEESTETSGVVEMGTKQGDERRTRLNPKASNSWLRWNSPTTSFPRNKGKGKEVLGDMTPRRRGSTIGDGRAERTEGGKGDEREEGSQGAGNTIKPSKTVLATIPPPPQSTPDWFTKNPPPATPTLTTQPEPITDQLAPPTDVSKESPIVGNVEVSTTTKDIPGGWKEYFTWGRRGGTRPAIPSESEPQPAIPNQSDTTTTFTLEPPIPVMPSRSNPSESESLKERIDESGPVKPQFTAKEDDSEIERQVEAAPQVESRTEEVASDATIINTIPRKTWGSFLYGIVVPQTGPSPAEPTRDAEAGTSETIHPTSATAEQPPVHVDNDPTSEINDLSDEEPNQTPVPSEEVGLKPPTSTAPRRSSQASTTGGWLNYLAFRASQKKVENPASSVATGETAQEVMDFSNDPNFPTESQPQAQPIKPADSAKPNAKTTMPPPSGLPDKKKKRLSTSSIKSATSVVPIPPSPQGQSKTVTAASTPAPSQKVSALPPPPQIPAAQPNLVIPSFSTTFDRPPRSLLPPKPANPAPAPQPGLAWRALGAMGSYVYPGQEKVEDKVKVGPTETRGMKEGREIGTDLPRRIGLSGEDPDEGWKNVKRVVVVGVHGWFPAKIVNSVIGEPTGTSSKFANMMGQAVKKFFDDKGIDDIRLTLIPLEGEGTIEHRVDRLYKSYLSNPAWINDLRRADAIFFAAHSQGCIVTTHLISRLIAQGHIKTPLNAEAVARCSWAFGPVSIVPPSEPRSPRSRQAHTVPVNVEEGGYQKVCMLAMCGVHQGPFFLIGTSTVILQPYLQWFESPAARELFEFQDTTSAVSQAYQRALAMVLENEVRVVLLSSLNDQVVPIYGSSFSAASHPLLLRALFVDGASYSASDFMTNLLCFSFMLRNAGISDQHLIEHLSEATAGSLTGVGHSTPYEEPASFALAVDYLFHAAPLHGPSPDLVLDHFSAREGRNDFELPWIMRALVDSPEIKDLFPGELRDLKEGVLHWKPTTKALRDIKKKLEPMAGRQSKLGQLKNSPSSVSVASGLEPGSPAGNKTLAPPIGKPMKSRL